MQQPFISSHDVDGQGNPEGGYAGAIGIGIVWQRGPLGAPDAPDRKEPNGAFVETVIAMVIDRLTFYQDAAGGRFNCRENAVAIMRLEEALASLRARTDGRTRRGVEGTHER